MGKSLPLVIWVLAGIVVAVTIYILVSFTGAVEQNMATDQELSEHISGGTEREILASVGSFVLYSSDLAYIRVGENAVEGWIYDQLLACAAQEAGLENPSISNFVQQRAKQLYLRDLMVETVINSVDFPSDAEVMAYMHGNPELYMVERHYFQIIAADSLMADSIHTRLDWGQNFQVTAQNISLGQKAAIGGDLGFIAGGEMLQQGLPSEIALLDGLADIVPSTIGWHIFKVSETRALYDTLRVKRSAAQGLYNFRIKTAIDSVLFATENRLAQEVVN